ncbi:hypothetical protein TeGR_g12309, partial [Tetraparma gracilis]
PPPPNPPSPYRFRDADPEFGLLQSKEVEDHLLGVLRGYNVDVLRGGGGKSGSYIEVRPKGVDKGAMLNKIIELVSSRGVKGEKEGEAQDGFEKKIDFALVMGDDKCDEPMFRQLRSVGAKAKKQKVTNVRRGNDSKNKYLVEHLSQAVNYYTCTVGKKPSEAANFVADVDAVHELLTSLNKVNTRERQFASAADLSSLGKGGGIGADWEIPAHLSKQADLFAKMSISSNAQTISAGITRSVSMNVLSASKDPASAFPAWGEARPVSNTLAGFLNAIDDEEEEEGNFF